MEEFFKAFDIPSLGCKKYKTNCHKYGECEQCENYDKEFKSYPEIDYIELIAILTRNKNVYINQMLFKEHVKIDILKQCRENKELIYREVRELFIPNENQRTE